MSEDTQRLASQEALGFDDHEAESNATTPRAGGAGGSLFETVLHGHPASSPTPRKAGGFSSAGLARRNPEDARKSATKNPIIQSLLQNKAALRAKIAKEQQRRKIEKSQSVSQENSIGHMDGAVAINNVDSTTEDRDTKSIEEQQQQLEEIIFTPSPSTQITSDDDDDDDPPQPNAAVSAVHSSSSCDTNDAEEEDDVDPIQADQKQPSSLLQKAVGSATNNTNTQQQLSVSTDTPDDEKPLFKPPHQNLVDACNNMWAETPMSPPTADDDTTTDDKTTSAPANQQQSPHQEAQQEEDNDEDDAAASETQERSPTTISPEGGNHHSNPNKYFEDFIREFHEPTQEEDEEEVLSLTLRVGECVLGTQVPDLTPKTTQNAAVQPPPSQSSSCGVVRDTAAKKATIAVVGTSGEVVTHSQPPPTSMEKVHHSSSMERRTSTIEGGGDAPTATHNTIGEEDSAFFVAPVAAVPQSPSSQGSTPPPPLPSKSAPMWYKCKKRYWHRRTYTGGCIVEVRWGGRWHPAVVVSVEADSVYNVRWIKKKYLKQVMELYCARLQGREIDLETLAEGSSSGTLEEAEEVKAVLQRDHASEFDSTIGGGDIRVPVGAVPREVTEGKDLYFDDSSLLGNTTTSNNNVVVDCEIDDNDEDSMSITETVKKHNISSSQAHLLFGTQSSASSIVASSSPIAEPDMQQPIDTAEPSPIEGNEEEEDVVSAPISTPVSQRVVPTSDNMNNTAADLTTSPTLPNKNDGGVEDDVNTLTTPPQELATNTTHHTFCWSTHTNNNTNASETCGTQLPVVGGTQSSGRVLEGVHVLLLGGYGLWTPQAPSQLDITTVNPSIAPSPRRIVGNLLRSIFGVSKVHEGLASLLRALPDLIGGNDEQSSTSRDNVLVIGLTNGSSIPQSTHHGNETEGASGDDFAAFLEPFTSIRGGGGDTSSVSPLRGSQQQLYGGSSIVASPSRDGESLLHIQMRYNMIGVRALGLEPIDGDVLLSPRIMVALSLVEEEQAHHMTQQHHPHLSDRVVRCQGEINLAGLDDVSRREVTPRITPFQQFIRMVSGSTPQSPNMPYPTAIPLHDRVLARHVILLPNVEDIVPHLESLRNSEEVPPPPMSPNTTTDPTAIIGKKRGRPSSESHSVNPQASNLLRSASELNVVINRLRTILAVAGATVADSAEEAIVALQRGRSVVQQHGTHLTEEENNNALQDVDTNIELELLLSTIWLISPNDILSCCSTPLNPLVVDPSIATIKQVEQHAATNLPPVTTMAPWTRVACHVATARPIVQSIIGCSSLLLEDAKTKRGEEVRAKGPAWLRSTHFNNEKANDEITPVREEIEYGGGSTGGNSVAPPLSEVEQQQPPDTVIERALYIDDDYNEEDIRNYMSPAPPADHQSTITATDNNHNDTVATTAGVYHSPDTNAVEVAPSYAVSESEFMVPSIIVSDRCTVCVGDDYYVTTPPSPATDSEGDVEEEEESELGRVEQICIRQTLHTLGNGDVECVGEEVLVMMRLYDFSVVSVRRVQHTVAQPTNTLSSNTSGVVHDDHTTTTSSLGAKRSRGEVGEATSATAGPRVETRRLRRPRVHLSPFRTKVVPLSSLDLVTPTYVIEEALLDHVYVLAPSDITVATPLLPPESPRTTFNTGAASSGRTPLLPPPPLPPPTTPAAPHHHQHTNPYITALPASSPPHNRYGFPVRSP